MTTEHDCHCTFCRRSSEENDRLRGTIIELCERLASVKATIASVLRDLGTIKDTTETKE